MAGESELVVFVEMDEEKTLVVFVEIALGMDETSGMLLPPKLLLIQFTPSDRTK